MQDDPLLAPDSFHSPAAAGLYQTPNLFRPPFKMEQRYTHFPGGLANKKSELVVFHQPGLPKKFKVQVLRK